MQMSLFSNKWLVSNFTGPEKRHLMRYGVNVSLKGTTLVLEDNIFNRILLNITTDNYKSKDKYDLSKISKYTRDYQAIDIENMLKNKQTLNQNKPGYGKTFETIEYCRLLNLKKILIICPKSVIQQWKDQFEKWWPEVAQYIVEAPSIKKDAQIYITNYEQLRDTTRWQKCKMFTWDIIVCDESHRIKNRNSKTTQNILQIPALRRMPLTGTPILNKPDDLWQQLNFMGVEYSGNSYWEFAKRFCDVDTQYGQKPIGLTPSDVAKNLLVDSLKMMSVGGDDHQVTEGKNIIYIDLPMGVKQKNLYKKINNLAMDELSSMGITIKNAMDQQLKLQQVTTNPEILQNNIENVKFDWLLDFLEDTGNIKVVVFTKYAKALKNLEKVLLKHKIDCATYYGDLNSTQREEQKQKFIKNKDCRVIIGTIGAMGTGVDGFQNVTNTVVFLDREWNPGINQQAEDRVNRSGQKGMTNIWILQCKNTIDKYVDSVINRKQQDIMEVFKLCQG